MKKANFKKIVKQHKTNKRTKSRITFLIFRIRKKKNMYSKNKKICIFIQKSLIIRLASMIKLLILMYFLKNLRRHQQSKVKIVLEILQKNNQKYYQNLNLQKILLIQAINKTILKQKDFLIINMSQNPKNNKKTVLLYKESYQN